MRVKKFSTRRRQGDGCVSVEDTADHHQASVIHSFSVVWPFQDENYSGIIIFYNLRLPKCLFPSSHNFRMLYPCKSSSAAYTIMPFPYEFACLAMMMCLSAVQVGQKW